MLLAAVVLQTLFIAAGSARGQYASRRSVIGVGVGVPAANLPLSKGGWRPVVGGGGFSGYSLLSNPLQAPKYKSPVAGDLYPTASKPAPVRDSNKLTSIAQSYKPTTLRTVPVSNPNAPISSYFNPFSLPNSGLSHYKIIQNYPSESVVIRNPNSAYQTRPLYAKYPMQIQNSKYKQPLHSAMMQPLNGNQYHMYPTTMRNPQDLFSKQVEPYARPAEADKRPEIYRPEPTKKPTEVRKPEVYKPDGYNVEPYRLEVYKPQVYKIPDSASSPQSVIKQQVKTAQQALAVGTLKPPPPSIAPYQYFKEEKFSPIPPSILGSFGTFGLQSVKARDPAFSGTKTTYLPPAPTKHTIFNSFSFSPAHYNQDKYATTTPKVKPGPNQIVYGNTFADLKNVQPQAVKQNVLKVEGNLPNKVNFKASPQDPFAKPSAQPQYINQQQQQQQYQQQQPQIGFYHPLKFTQFPQFPIYYSTVPTTTADTSIFSTNAVSNRFPSQLNPPYTTFSTFYGQHSKPEYEQNKQPIHNVSPITTIHTELPQYSIKPTKDKVIDPTPETVSFRATYDVTETYDIQTQPPRGGWLKSPESYNYDDQQQPPSQQAPQEDNTDLYAVEDPTNLPQPELPTQYTIITEANENKPYENSLTYETDIENQSRRPLGDDFEPVGKHKLKDYYYRVTTPTYSDDEVTTRRHHNREHGMRGNGNSPPSDDLATLAPNRHFRRPPPPLELTEKERNRKKNKNRRRRPTSTLPPKEEVIEHTTTPLPIDVYTTEVDGTVHTVRPRVRVPIYGKPKSTTPTVTTDLSTSALPTVSPTTPTVIRSKLPNRRTTTLPPNEEEHTTISTSSRLYENDEKGSSIMKISNRQSNQRTTTNLYDFNTSETPDFSHKQDEKDTPTSDIAVNTSLGDVNKNNVDMFKPFEFHVNVKPIDNKLEMVPTTQRLESGHFDNKSQEDYGFNRNRETEKDHELNVITTTPKDVNVAQHPGKLQRPRLKNKYDNNRPRFSVKDYRNRMSSTTTTERSQDSLAPKLRYPQRRLPVYNENKLQIDNDNSTEAPRKRFTPKEPRHKTQAEDNHSTDTTTERQSFSTRTSVRHRASASTEGSNPEPVTAKISSRIRSGSRNSVRRTSTTEEPEQSTQGTVHIKRPSKKKHKDTDSMSEGTEDVVMTEASIFKEPTSERHRSESAIMKIAKDDRKPANSDVVEHSLSEHSRRVSDLTLAASKDYNTPGMFKTVSPNSRRIPNYFMIATDDPILPIEAFFPQLNQKKES